MDTSKINSAIQLLIQTGHNIGIVKDLDNDEEDSGIPREMLVSMLEDDWGTWRAVPSKVTSKDVVSVFADFGVTAPSELIAYYLADCHLIDQVASYGEQGAMPIPIPSDNPLGPLREYLTAWQQMIPLGYLPLCDYGDGWGPICYKLLDGSVIWFDHEQLHSLSSPLKPNSLQSLEHQLHPNLTAFFNELFGIQQAEG